MITTVNPADHARTLKAIKVCNSWVYVIDEVLLPMASASLADVPAVNSTFLKALASLGGTTGCGGQASTAAAATYAFGAITDPVGCLLCMP